jgi:hypothetical protein
VIGGTVTVVTECNCGSKSLVELLGGTGGREKHLVGKGLIKIKIMPDGILTWLYCRVEITNLLPDTSD